MRQAVLTSALCLLTSAFANARVVRVEVKSRTDYWNGTYERIQARVTYALDPANPHNKDIADLTQPVEFRGDVDIARPQMRARCRHRPPQERRQRRAVRLRLQPRRPLLRQRSSR